MGGGMSAVFAVLGGRLYQLQIRDGEQYWSRPRTTGCPSALSRRRAAASWTVSACERPNSRRNYRVLLVSEHAEPGVDEALDTIGKVLPAHRPADKKILHDIANNKKFVPVPVAENLSLGRILRGQYASALPAGQSMRCRRGARLSLRQGAGAYPGLCRFGVAQGTGA
jgi:penicillin-binding protein 2